MLKHKKGYNCAQTIACTYCDLVGVDEETMFKLTEALGLGMGGMEEIEGRFLNNGVLDHLLEERKKGRIRNLGFSFHGNLESIKYILSYHEKVHWDFCMIQMNYSDWRFSDIGQIYDLADSF